MRVASRRPGTVSAGLSDRGTLLYLHGGAWCLHLPGTYRRLAHRLAALTGLRVLLPDYRLAPEHPFPAAVDDCFATYRWLVDQGYADRPLAIAGDSAGGSLTLVTMMRARDASLPLPACAALLSPSTDLTMSGPSIEYNERADPMFANAALTLLPDLYCPGVARSHPWLSPLFGQWQGLPPLLFQAGSTEMLLDDSVRAHDRAIAAGVDARIKVWPGLPHVAPLFTDHAGGAPGACRDRGVHRRSYGAAHAGPGRRGQPGGHARGPAVHAPGRECIMKHVEYTLRDGVAVLAFANPPVNSLSHALRQELVESLDRAVADAAVRAIVLIGSNGTFSGGADIKEFGTPAMLKAPSLLHVIAAFEDSTKPVVAAIAGLALGGGLELALGCHYRVVHKDAKLGLPEVKLGLLPGAGGTQRLPRLVGMEAALNMIVGGEPIPAQMFAKTPLVDRLADGDLARGGGGLRGRDRPRDQVRIRACATARSDEPEPRRLRSSRATPSRRRSRTSRRRSRASTRWRLRPPCRSRRGCARSGGSSRACSPAPNRARCATLLRRARRGADRRRAGGHAAASCRSPPRSSARARWAAASR